MDMPKLYDREQVESILRQVKPEVRELAEYSSPPQGESMAKMNQNENPYDIPDSLKEVVLREMRYRNWSRYPEYNPWELREKIARRLTLNAEQVILGNGSNSLIYAAVTALVSAGDPIVLSPPSFSLFEMVANIFQAKTVSIPLNTDFSYDEEALLKAVASTKLSIFSSPSNPTGQTMDLRILEKILKRTPGLVLWDEAYGEFCEKTAVPLLSQYPNLLILRTFSKAFGLAGLRIGYLMGHPSLVKQIQKVNVPYNVNLFSLLVASRLLDIPQWVEIHVKKIIQERGRLFKSMSEIPGIKPFSSKTNFILFRVDNGLAVYQKLRELGIFVRDMGGYTELKNYLRVTVGTPEENDAFLKALEEIVEKEREIER
jgi:histidinol-phosphate aminotransferase